MDPTDTDKLAQYRKHRETLLPLVENFAEELEQQRAHLTKVAARLRRGGKPAGGTSGSQALRDRILSDEKARDFQRRWRVLLDPQLGPDGYSLKQLLFVDDFFIGGGYALPDPRARDLMLVYPNRRFFLIDLEAGKNEVDRALANHLTGRFDGEVSRLVSDPPYALEDIHNKRDERRDYAKEDPIAVRRLANRPGRDYAAVAVDAYPVLAKTVGAPVRHRYRREAEYEDRQKWSRLVAGIKKRWPSLRRALVPPFD